MATGKLLTKIIVRGVAGFATSMGPLVTVTATTGSADTVITDVGLLWIQTVPASTSVQIQQPASTWADVVAASTTTMPFIPSDGTNFRVHNANTAADRSVTYYVIG